MLSRAYFDHAFWEEPRAYSRAEAWLDFVRMAAWRTHRRMIGGAMIEIPRGGIVAAERFLSDRWMWSRTKVRAFVDLLSDAQMIKREKDQGISLFLLCNYERFNTPKDREKTEEEPRRDQGRTKVEEDIKEEDTLSPASNDSDEHPPGWEPPLKLWIAECARYSVPAWYAEKRWDNYGAKGWASGHTPLKWKRLCQIVRKDFVNDGSPMTEKSAAPHGKQKPSHDLTTKPNNGF